jgi:hypothetical protein
VPGEGGARSDATRVVDAATATPDADFSSGAERELDQLRSRVLDVLNCSSSIEFIGHFCFLEVPIGPL